MPTSRVRPRAPRSKARQARADARLQQAGLALRTSLELDALLDADATVVANPALRAGIKKRIQRLCPHLREM